MTRGRGMRCALLRTRITLTTVAVVVAAMTAVGTGTWFITRHNMLAQLDDSIRTTVPPQGTDVMPEFPVPDFDLLCATTASEDVRRFLRGVQLIKADGAVCAPDSAEATEIEPTDRLVTAPVLRDGRTRTGEPVRAYLHPLDGGDVLVISRSLTELQQTLGHLRDALVTVSLLGAILAAAAAQLLTRRSFAPMENLTEAAEHIAETENLDTPVTVTGRDEVGRLGRAFTAMTTALAESRRRQRDLVNDAAHELRTPLTSLRTNIDLLARSTRTGRPLPDRQHDRMIEQLQSQAREFTDLVNELVALARDERGTRHEPLDVATVVDRAVRRAANRSRHHNVSVHTTPWRVTGDAGAIERAVLNLLDNAVKFSPPGTAITVHSEPGWITVTDEGPGIPEPHRPRVFERFWRAPEARPLPGSGLGLAIVADTAITHGGTAEVARPREGCGTTVRITLPPG